MLDLIPAIDIKDGACVRLVQGDLDKNITVYSKDPRDMARQSSVRAVSTWWILTAPAAAAR
jgi:phosphoribosylformimino-5-aminoimidazole carboxamide ribotide isomerase